MWARMIIFLSLSAIGIRILRVSLSALIAKGGL